MKKLSNFFKKNKIIFFLILIFITSFLVRFEYIFHSEPYNFEWITPAALFSIDITNRTNSFKNFLAPSLTYPDGTNKFINNNSTHELKLRGFMNNDGEYFYLSYPPFAFMLPFILFRVFQIPFHIISLKLFAVLIHLIISVLLFKLVSDFTKKEGIGIIAFSLYIFLPNTLLWHTIVYFSDTLVQLFFVLCLYILYKIISLSFYSSKLLYFYALSLFFMCYTDWLGFIFASVIVLYTLIYYRKIKIKYFLSVNIIVPFFAFILILLQYSYVIGLKNFIETFFQKYFLSYKNGNLSFFYLGNYLSLFNHYKEISLLFLLTFIFFFIYYIDYRYKMKSNFPYNSVLVISFLTTLMHHIVFLHWSGFDAHGFSSLKGMVFITLFVSYIFYLYWYKSFFSENIFFKFVMIAYILAIYLNSVYLFIKNIPNFPSNYVNSYCYTARDISNLSQKDEVIFIKQSDKEIHKFPLSPIFPYCSKRNLSIYISEEVAKDILFKNNTYKGVIFTLGYSSLSSNTFVGITKVERFDILKVSK